MPDSTKQAVFEQGPHELRRWIVEHGQPPYRAGQVLQWIVGRRAQDFAQMTDLPAPLRTSLAEQWTILRTNVALETTDDDGTTKLVLELADSQTIECVLIPEGDRRTVCISTQVGCGMGCVFCASGLGGVARNLTPPEIVEQLLHLQSRLPGDERINHIVIMGMGEPLANLEALLSALDFATNQKEGLGVSARNITISTVGLPAKIRRLAELRRQYHLAVSLHAPNDRLRQRIVPMAEKVTLAEILAAADDFRRLTSRQVTFEYVLLAGVNDRPEHARELARLLRGRDAMINLIPYNSVAGLPYATPDPAAVRDFAAILRDARFVVKVRKRKGGRIDAACGQLRRIRNQVVSLGASKGTPE